MNRYLILMVTILTTVGLGTVMTKTALAQDSDEASPMTALVQKVANRFGLNQDEVQAVFDEDRAERRAFRQQDREARQEEMWQRMTERLDQAVADGNISEAQKQLILEKHQEMQAECQARMENGDELTFEQRQALREQHREQMEAWAEENEIDLEYLMGGMGMKNRGGSEGNGRRGGPGGMGMSGYMPANGSTTN